MSQSSQGNTEAPMSKQTEAAERITESVQTTAGEDSASHTGKPEARSLREKPRTSPVLDHSGSLSFTTTEEWDEEHQGNFNANLVVLTWAPYVI